MTREQVLPNVVGRRRAVRRLLWMVSAVGICLAGATGCSGGLCPFGDFTCVGPGALSNLKLLKISGQSSLVSYACISMAVNSVDANGVPTPVTQPTPVYLSGLGAGSSYASLSDCRSNKPATTLTLLPQQNSVSFYYRTVVAEPLTLSAGAVGYQSQGFAATTYLFQVLGQSTLTLNPVAEQTMSQPQGIFTLAGRLYVADANNNRILVWSSIPTADGQAPDLVLGQPNFDSTDAGISATSLSYPTSVYSDGTRLYTTDSSNSRVLIWNTIPTVNGQAADIVLGAPNMTTQGSRAELATSMYLPFSVYGSGAELYVADLNNDRILVWNSTPTTNGQAADRVLGEPNLTTYGYTASATGMMEASSVFSDGTRLFMGDMDANRVLIWNSIPNTNDQAADVVLGHTTMNSCCDNPTLSATSLYGNSYVYSDGIKLYVADSYNGRVLIWNSIPTVNGHAADIVLGAPNMTTAGTLSYPGSVYSDGTRLYVGDQGNDRVLVWNSIPTTNGQAPDIVLGQPNLTTQVSRRLPPSATNIFPLSTWFFAPGGGVNYSKGAVFSDGTKFYVADASNNRVLIWNEIPSANGQPADLVLGQASMTTNTSGTSVTAMASPYSVYSDGTRLFVADYANNRVLIWNAIPTTNQQPANLVLGQPNMTSNTVNNGGLGAQSLCSPSGVYGDGTRLFVVDGCNNRVLIWNTIPTTNQQPANLVLGQPNMTSNTVNNGGLSAQSFDGPLSAYSDGTRLFVADDVNNRVLVWNAIPTANQQPADLVLGQPNMTSNTVNNGGLGAQSLDIPSGVYGDGTRLFVADYGNNRVLVWNAIPTTNQQPADSVLGQPNMASSVATNGGLSAQSLAGPFGGYSDGVRVWIVDTHNSRILLLPLF